MPTQYPFVLSTNKIEPVLARIRTAAKPEKLTQDLLATWGFTASNDRAMVRLLKVLGFLTEGGQPTSYYDTLRDPRNYKRVLADRIKDVYAELFAMDAKIHGAGEDEVKGAISRITGKDADTVKRYYSTFKTLTSLADFSDVVASDPPEPEVAAPGTSADAPPSTPSPLMHPITEGIPPLPSQHRKSEYHYNIQIHLPVTTDISVYNAIFKSLRENLGV